MQGSDEDRSPAKMEILLIEDNPADIVLFKQILQTSSVLYSLTVCVNGLDAIDRLQHQAAGQPLYRPGVVFLDLNLPGKSGAEILAEMKADPVLAVIPVAILTGSDHPDDRATCASLGVDTYLNKAVALEDFFVLAAKIDGFLLNLQGSTRCNPAPELAATTAA